MSTYFLLDPIEFLYYFYSIRGELIYYKSDVTFVLAYYYYVFTVEDYGVCF